MHGHDCELNKPRSKQWHIGVTLFKIHHLWWNADKIKFSCCMYFTTEPCQQVAWRSYSNYYCCLCYNSVTLATNLTSWYGNTKPLGKCSVLGKNLSGKKMQQCNFIGLPLNIGVSVLSSLKQSWVWLPMFTIFDYDFLPVGTFFIIRFKP